MGSPHDTSPIAQSPPPAPVVCPHCHQIHPAPDKWLDAEVARRSVTRFPEEALAPLRAGRDYYLNVFSRFKKKRDGVLQVTWPEYYQYLVDRAHEVHPKRTLHLTSLSHGPRRQDHNHLWYDRLYFDLDGPHPWTHLEACFRYYGLAGIFHESSGSVRSRTRGETASPTGWHVVLPLAHRVTNPWATPDDDPPSSPVWGHYQAEVKRAYRHTAGVLAALARFPGVGEKCGFDLSTSAFCNPRFLGTRAVPGGPLPYLRMVPGPYGLDWFAFLAATGFAWRPYVPAPPRSRREVSYRTASGARTATVHVGSELYEDVKNRFGVHEFLQRHLGLQPTTPLSGGRAHYFCPIPTHDEATNPSGLPGGPNRTAFHVFPGARAGHELWCCHGDCQKDHGDVITLAARVWQVSNGKAAWRLAQELGLDTSKYLARAEVDPADYLPDEAETSPEFEALEEGDRPRAQRLPTKVRQLEHVGDWLERHLLDHPRFSTGIRAVVRMLVESEEKDANRCMTGELLQDPDEVAATIWSLFHDALGLEQAVGEVLDVVDRLRSGRPTVGRGWLRRQVGHRGLFDLAVATHKDDLAAGRARSFPSYLRRALRYDRFVREETDGRVLLWLGRQIRGETPEGETEKQRTARLGIAKRLLRPLGCKKTEMKLETTYGRDFGSFRLRCQSRMCMCCVTTDVQLEWSVLLRQWQNEDGPIYFAQQQLETLAQVEVLKEKMRRLGRPNLSVTGFDEDGRPRVTYATNTGVDMAYVTGKLCAFAGIHKIPHKMREWKVRDPEEALALVMTERASYAVHQRDLVRRAERADVAVREGRAAPEQRDRAVAALREFVRWSYRRQVVVSRSKRGLPWASREALRRAGQEAAEAAEGAVDRELMEGERIRYTVLEAETGLQLATRVGRPFTIDEAVKLLLRNAERIGHARTRKRDSRSAQAQPRAPAAPSGS